MELNEILNGFAGAEGRPVNNGCGEVEGCRGGFLGGSWIWLILLFWLCCGGCGFGGFGGFGGYGRGCCCDDHHHHHDECYGNMGGCGFGGNGCSWIIWIIILCVLCSGRGFGCFGRRDEKIV